MVRWYDEAVQVRTAQEVLGATGDEPLAGRTEVPVAFVWRGRPYVVREVLAHWYERRAWWHAAGAAVQGGERTTAGRAAQGAVLPVPVGAHPPAGAARPSVAEVAQECQVWRVEAMAGRSSPTGVYDLTQHPADESGAARWLLTRLAD